MKSALFSVVSLLAASNALYIPVKRQTENQVDDGSFEDIPDSAGGEMDFTSGPWTFNNQASFAFNLADGPATPYGEKYASFFNVDETATAGTVSQQISELGDGMYTLSYAIEKRSMPASGTCKFSVAFGPQFLDNVQFQGEDEEPWATRQTSFTPETTSANLNFKVDCDQEGFFEINLDNISLTPEA